MHIFPFLQIVEVEQMVYLGERVRNCGAVAAKGVSQLTSAALPAAPAAPVGGSE